MEWPGPCADDLAVIDPLSVLGELLLVLAKEKIDEIVFGLPRR